MKLSILLAGSILTSAIVGNAYAQTCGAQPSCADLGYTLTSTSSCVGNVLKCPFDKTKYYCTTMADAAAAAMPDYSRRQSRSIGTTYTATTNGFIVGYDQGRCDAGNNGCENVQNYQIIIDGWNVRQANSNVNWSHNTWSYPIKKGSTYRVSSAGYMFLSYYFVPTN